MGPNRRKYPRSPSHNANYIYFFFHVHALLIVPQTMADPKFRHRGVKGGFHSLWLSSFPFRFVLNRVC